jgi:hypothetical protein
MLRNVRYWAIQVIHLFRQIRIKVAILLLGKNWTPFSHRSVAISEATAKPLGWEYKYELAITAIVKNEGVDLIEWLDFHFIAGVEHIYLYENGSTDNTLELLQPYIDEGIVTLFVWPLAFYQSTQVFAYAHSTLQHRFDVKWMAFIDADEFIFPSEAKDLREVLAECIGFSTIHMRWRCFGAGGHVSKPKTGVIANFLHMADIEKADPGMKSELTKIKTIARLDKVSNVKVHDTETSGDTLVQPKTILLNHYITKSRDEFEFKLQKMEFYATNKDDKWPVIRRRIFEFISSNSVKNTEILDFLKRAKASR